MRKVSRRKAIAGLIGSAVAITGLGDTALGIGQNAVVPAFAGRHQPKPLPFDTGKLNGISEKLIRSHWENNYTGSVKALNAVEQRLSAAYRDDTVPAYVYGGLKREELIRTGSVVLHELYFENLGGNGKADGKALSTITKWFGDYEVWEAEFKKTANALSGGSGWTMLAYNHHTAELHNYWAADHSANSPFSTPILVLDMYEHSYQMDFGAAASKYVDAFMKNVNWDEVNRRLEKSIK